jgi:hypothetical protein
VPASSGHELLSLSAPRMRCWAGLNGHSRNDRYWLRLLSNLEIGVKLSVVRLLGVLFSSR